MSQSNINNIKRAIFEVDSLSPLLFCVEMIPRSNELNHSRHGFKLYSKTINESKLLLGYYKLRNRNADVDQVAKKIKIESRNWCLNIGNTRLKLAQ